MDGDKDWKHSLGFPINYESDQSSEDDFDMKDVVMRHPPVSSARYMLQDSGDGSEADLLGSTPPRARIRNKEIRKTLMDSRHQSTQIGDRSKRASMYEVPVHEQISTPGRKRGPGLKQVRSQERDSKNDMTWEPKSDSLPSPNPGPDVPTLVESCNRFMSLSSRLKCRELCPEKADEGEVEKRLDGGEELPHSRVNFHKTFSMLINMGNVDKGCRRAISREEQVWQNELKDLIWLELQAKIAGRTPAQQDAYLCAQRNIVPTIVQNIIDYRFMNPNPCKGGQRLCVIEGSREDLTVEHSDEKEDHTDDADIENDDDLMFGCLSFSCQRCNDAIGKALRELGTLLDSFYNSVTLYPSSQAMTVEHPLIATQLFKNRLKAMCLWYNVALHMRVKVVMVRRMLRSLRLKSMHRGHSTVSTNTSEALSRQSSECSKPCQVRFNIDNPSDSNNSDSSSQSEIQKDLDKDSDGNQESDGKDGNDSSTGTDKRCDKSELPTPEIVISDSKYGTNDTSTSVESGYTSANERVIDDDIYDTGSLEELTRLRLLGKCDLSPYRTYHTDVLKTQGVRRSMMFINKMRNNTLRKAFLTLNKLNIEEPDCYTQETPAEVFADTKTEEDKTETVLDNDAKEAQAFELRRYGCWSEESIAMRLPSYRNHFLLLSSICMEAVHDYLSLRLEGRPEQPSCLTVKQLIHELKEGLDIATEMRATYAASVEAALRGSRAGAAAAARRDLLLLVRTFDATVETVFKQYLSYLTTMSLTEHMPRSCLEAEWAFTARLAKRAKCAVLLAPVAFTDIACNQLNRIQKQFESKLGLLKEMEIEHPETPEHSRQIVYSLCRGAQTVYSSEREASFQCAQWARSLAARLRRAPRHHPANRHQRKRIFNSLMSFRDCIVGHVKYIQERSRESDEWSQELGDQVASRVRELLLHVYKWAFEIHKELHRFVNDSSSPRFGPGCKRRSAISVLRPRFMRSEGVGDDGETDKLFEQLNNYTEGQTQSSIELLLADEPSQPPEPAETGTSPTGAPASPEGPDVSEEEKHWAARVARAVIEFARCWMQFVMERCDRGRGLRPRWASQGLEFLMLACDPCNTKHLTDEEFEELKQLMDSCISHVIGSRPSAPRTSDAAASPVLAPRSSRPRQYSPVASYNGSRDVPCPPTPPIEPDPFLSFHQVDFPARRHRVIEATRTLDQARDEKLRDMKTVGRVLESTVASYEPKLRQVTFKWQRGLKIGAGTFGKVYTVVNTETGQLLAMKELSIGAGDRRALQRAANELKVLEGVIHPHLVRYYGCEVHREEMLIFMELCVEGSLEALLATTGPLDEQQMRRYTKQLVSAVLELHTRNIAHRDIKSGNIFLTNDGHCLKLGDFGCAVKIRGNTTAAGELQGCVGTQAYMAPEVFMKSSGHGRAADVWSLGCVVTEMASGKRPFSEYDSNYQIMFVVGMGGRPHIPASLSAEGEDFCTRCLTHDPEVRPRAEELSMHHFLMVKSDEDCKCEPAFLIA